LRAEELRGEMRDVDGLLAGLDEIDASVIGASPRLRVIARYGVGTSNVDLKAAAARGVVVTNTPGANSEAVAELAIGLMFALLRNIPQVNAAVHAGAWPTLRGAELAGKTIGVLGFGRIGRGVARRATALGCEVVAHDPFVDAEVGAAEGAQLLPLHEVVELASILSLHLPVTPTTRGIVNRALLERMPPGSYLVNTARGELVVNEDLLWALDTGRLRGAAIDTLVEEPPPPDHPFLKRENIVLTPHMGAHTGEASTAMGRTAMEDLLTVLSGGTPRFPVRDDTD
jgi:phosphoglycerate dehydrogenase-like enzyme